ncbi:MAG: hypothetical protein LBE11_04600 [Prevotellaceae bacterium]|jgi:hypothetical protein|nr:hypothetical protein [Prevotellaceae bacterium]
MKKTILQTVAVLLILAGMTVSCGKENTDDTNFREITIGSENPVINYANNGIYFKFCLLNENGEPSTIFNEGENFSFYFSTINKRNELLYFDYDFIYLTEPVFCRVYNTDRQDFGKPYLYNGAIFISLDIYGFEHNDTIAFQVPWVDDRTNWGWYSVALKSLNQNYLPKGKYYTEFEYDFVFRRTLNNDEDSLKTDKIKFKINFEIK